MVTIVYVAKPTKAQKKIDKFETLHDRIFPKCQVISKNFDGRLIMNIYITIGAMNQ